MTKEEILKKHWGVLPLINSLNEPDPIYAAMDEYAKQQAIAFGKYVMVDYKLSLHKDSPILNDEEIYDQFLEHQKQNNQ